MPNPTRQEIIDAHDALGELRALAESNPPRHDTHAEKLESRIFAALPPLPQPTMAEVEWDDDKHYLAEAEHPTSGKVVMVFYTEDTYIYVLVTDEDETYGYLSSPSNLTPTGKRYTLTEDETHAR
nr:MAG TPA: hypothetical protein [Caudoviricetes sp.]